MSRCNLDASWTDMATLSKSNSNWSEGYFKWTFKGLQNVIYKCNNSDHLLKPIMNLDYNFNNETKNINNKTFQY